MCSSHELKKDDEMSKKIIVNFYVIIFIYGVKFEHRDPDPDTATQIPVMRIHADPQLW